MNLFMDMQVIYEFVTKFSRTSLVEFLLERVIFLSINGMETHPQYADILGFQYKELVPVC